MPVFINKVPTSNIAGKQVGKPPSKVDAGPIFKAKPGPPVPFIDRINIVVAPPVGDQEFLATALTAGPFFQEDSELVTPGPRGGFSLGKRLNLVSLNNPSKRPTLQISLHAKKLVKFRLDFIPDDLGASGLKELHDVLVTLGLRGWGYVIEYGHITRLDVTVDIAKLRMDDFIFLPDQGVTTRQWRRNGKLETYIHGKSSGNQTLLYSRKRKRLAKKQIWEGPSAVRIERRIVKPRPRRLDQLPKMENPFKSMSVVKVLGDPPPNDGNTYTWQLFKLAVSVQGVVATLALLSKEKRVRYRKHMLKFPETWWDPEDFWTRWPEMLEELKLASLEAWP